MFKVIAGYKFKELRNLTTVRADLLEFCRNRCLRGTILLSEEGMNCSASGVPEALQDLKNYLRELFQEDFHFKEHSSWRHPFKGMYVKIRKEIISMGVPDLDPQKYAAPSISPKIFAEWIEAKKDMTVLDTRNDYEVRRGKFKDAIDLNIKTFKEFSKKIDSIPDSAKEKPLVMYCTGGIRCEKASAFLLKDRGFKEVYQLEGGILQYFKDVGDKFYEGECVVFDQRGGINQKEIETTKCFHCEKILTEDEVRAGKLKAFCSCFYCERKKENVGSTTH